MRAHELPPVDSTPRRWPAVFHPAFMLAVMWLVEIFDRIFPGQWERFGLRAWDFSSLPGIVLAPLLHSEWNHLIGNSVPFLVLGMLIAFEGARRFWLVTLIVAVIGALGPLFLTAPGTITVGASGLVFGYFAYLLTRVFVAREWRPGRRWGVVAVAGARLSGRPTLAGIFAAGAGVSWQGHLTGALGGVAAALVLRGRPRDPQSSSPLGGRA